jgi:hypothetical protein
MSFANNKLPKLSIILGALILSSCNDGQRREPGPIPCSDEWLEFVETTVTTGDSQGHGPDVGSSEWRSVVEFKLGIRGDPSVPPSDTEEWCRYIDEKIRETR